MRAAAGAAAADAVIHTAFSHDFSRFAENGAAERSAIEALGSALAGTDWFARFAQIDAAASSAKTRQALAWHPSEPELLEDLDSAAYFPA